MSRLLGLSAVLALFLSAPALAGRTLDEPKAIKKAATGAPSADVQQALREADLVEQCGVATLRAAELRGMRCRLAVFAHLQKKRGIKGAAGVKATALAAEAALGAASSLASYDPLTRTPLHDEDRFGAHRLACGAAVAAWDALRAPPKGADEATRRMASDALAAPLGTFGPLGEAACACTARSLELAPGAGATLELVGALQGTLTARGCFLDESKVKAERGGPETLFSGDAARFSDDSTDAAALVAYAKTRDVSFTRCRDKFLGPAHVKDKNALQGCLCGELGKWRFPPKRERPEIDVRLPVREDSLFVVVKVSPPGEVLSCGPLEGALAR
jgi:hypothetical protein